MIPQKGGNCQAFFSVTYSARARHGGFTRQTEKLPNNADFSSKIAR